MSSSVSIDISALEGALSALTSLASSIESQRQRVVNGTPCSVPSLSDGTVATVASWLKDQEPELSTRLDLARLLDTHGAGVATYTTDADTLANTQQLLGHELAERVNDISYDTDADDLKMLNEILSNRATDVQVMSSMYQDLEPQGTARALSMLEQNLRFSGDQDQTALTVAETLRRGLATASHDPYFPSDYGKELTRWFVAPLLDQDEQEWATEHGIDFGAGASMLAFMMRDVDYGPEFLKSAADELAYFEKESEDGFQSATEWYYRTGYSPMDGENAGGTNVDPMAEMMRAMSRQPEVGYDFIREEGNADYFFDKRDWSNDGYDGISALADRVSTDPEIYRQHPEGAATIASQFVDWTADSPGFNAEDAKAASDSVSHLLRSYLPSMAAAMDGGGVDGDPGILDANIERPGYGELKNMPEFFRGDLAQMTGVAMSSEDGMAQLAGGVSEFRQTQVNAIAAELAEHPNDGGLRSELQSAMLDDSELRAFTTKIAGQTQIDEAHSTDQQRQFWTNLLAEGAKEIPIKPPIVGTIVDHGIDLGKDAVNDAWANSAQGVKDDWEINATNGIAQMNYESYAGLVQAGVVPMSEVPDAFKDHGELKGWNDIPADSQSSFGSRAGSELSPWVSDEVLENTYRDRFHEFYEDPAGPEG